MTYTITPKNDQSATPHNEISRFDILLGCIPSDRLRLSPTDQQSLLTTERRVRTALSEPIITQVTFQTHHLFSLVNATAQLKLYFPSCSVLTQ